MITNTTIDNLFKSFRGSILKELKLSKDKKTADLILKHEIGLNLRTGQVRIIDRTGDKLLYSKAEAATLLSVSLVSVCRYLKTGLLPSVQLGGRRLIPRDALIEWINRRTNQ